MFIENKYKIWYFNIINDAKERLIEVGEYVERHHIYPRSIYPELAKDKGNIVKV